MNFYRHVYNKNRNVSIPQAVSTVATIDTFENEKGLDVVSIPQAVSTVATIILALYMNLDYFLSFNTASGKYCCN